MDLLNILSKKYIRYSAKNKGFTLVELIIVLVIIIIISVTLMIRWPTNIISLSAQAELLASDIRYTQNLAMTQGQRFSIVLNTSANPGSYQIQYSNNGAPIQLPSGATTLVLGSGMTIQDPGAVLPNDYITFDTLGIPYIDNASTALAQNAPITIVSGSVTKTITVSPQTGRVQ